MQQPIHTDAHSHSIYTLARIRAHQLRQAAYAQCWATVGRLLGGLLQRSRPTAATGQRPFTQTMEV